MAEPNELINESSPYLIQHAYNPVRWHAWNAKNLEEAKALNKPLLISIGYSSCHWCHVMEHESFEDEDVAEVMNQFFYCIKVDREERPDVDQLYMTAANIITKRGGWPLNCFALADGRPFHAGTYFPKPNWIQLLLNVHEQYTSNYSKLEEYANKLTQGIRLQETVITDQLTSDLDSEALKTGVEKWKSKWDPQWGGMLGAPKFPMPNQYEFLMAYSFYFEDPKVDQHVQLSLDKMMYGGIYDQLGGGFARYSVDGIWKVPHFEKMLYDNAQLMSVYAKAALKYKNDNYLDLAKHIAQWLDEEFRDKSHMYFSAMDADSEGKEGSYYVWTQEELKTSLKELYPLARSYYSIEDQHVWEHGKFVLMRRKSEEDICKEFEITSNELRSKLKEINNILIKIRSNRPLPGIDNKCLCSWNAMTVSALLELYKASKEQLHLNSAINCLNAILTNQYQNGELKHSFMNGKPSIDGMLEDHAHLGLALINAFSITGEKEYYTAAVRLADNAIEKFFDPNKKIFYMSEKNEMILQVTEIYDNVIPSGNSSMIEFLQKLGLMNANHHYLDIVKELLGKIQEQLSQFIESHTNWALSLLRSTMPFYELNVVGPRSKEYSAEINNKFNPHHITSISTVSSELPMFKGRYKEGQTLFYVCRAGACEMPVNTIEDCYKLLLVNQIN